MGLGTVDSISFHWVILTNNINASQLMQQWYLVQSKVCCRIVVISSTKRGGLFKPSRTFEFRKALMNVTPTLSSLRLRK
jgi:hypothetical protein